MYNKKLWTPLAGIIRRVLPSSSRFSLYPSKSPIRSSAVFYFPSHLETPRDFANDTLTFLGNPNSFSRSFCLESAEKVDATNRCWACDAAAGTAPFLVCDSCRTIQPVDFSVDYFQIFRLERKYDIEVDSLEGKYKGWQKKLHPDLVHSKSEKERGFAAEQSARVIDAYHTLTKSLSRATYILRLEGIDVNEEETISDPELLGEIMEIREAVEEAPDSQALNQIRSQMEEKLEELANCFGNAFHSQKFNEAVACIRRMTYYQRVNEEILKKL
ncbi:hypothetical protein SLEP1_g5038 [Rubroshorea leprosula]|uniref:Co-chaperone HscB C-terminal oligomerisation domain-containing protein n=1 Tax=Rubroshorea leprosula TaxID=152421 RepID=A0AAV5HV14_9ROSI|nr:hypothetical protein SLEP1_g5038 [Rubroshorea leprosula]